MQVQGYLADKKAAPPRAGLPLLPRGRRESHVACRDRRVCPRKVREPSSPGCAFMVGGVLRGCVPSSVSYERDTPLLMSEVPLYHQLPP